MGNDGSPVLEAVVIDALCGVAPGLPQDRVVASAAVAACLGRRDGPEDVRNVVVTSAGNVLATGDTLWEQTDHSIGHSQYNGIGCFITGGSTQ